jgi:hypothetical protein
MVVSRGQKPLGWIRQKLLSTKMFFRQRILNNDTRFLEADYIGWAVSTSQYFQLLDSVDVALRLQVVPLMLVSSSSVCWMVLMRTVRWLILIWRRIAGLS